MLGAFSAMVILALVLERKNASVGPAMPEPLMRIRMAMNVPRGRDGARDFKNGNSGTLLNFILSLG